MNLLKLFEMQKALDEKILKEKGLEGKDLLPMKILALQVELGECANEWRGFKFWSKNQHPRTSKEPPYKGNPLLEEYVDCLHFILSIGHEAGHNANVFKGLEWSISKMFLQIHVIQSFTELMTVVNNLKTPDEYRYLVWLFIDLGFKLGFTWEQIEQAYISKNEVNHNRQANGY